MAYTDLDRPRWMFAAALALAAAGASCHGDGSGSGTTTAAGSTTTSGQTAGTGDTVTTGPGTQGTTANAPDGGPGGKPDAGAKALNNVPENACPWNPSQTCVVIGPTPLQTEQKMLLMPAPLKDKEKKRVEGMSKQFQTTLKQHAASALTAKPALSSSELPALSATPAITAAGAVSATAVANAKPRAPGVPGVPHVPATIAAPHTVPTVVQPNVSVHPALTATGLPVGAANCPLEKFFLCKPDVMMLTSGTVSTVDLELLDFIAAHDKCASTKGASTFLQLLQAKMVAALGNVGFHNDKPSIAQTPPELTMVAWKGTTNEHEVEVQIRQTAQQDGIRHALYLPTNKESFKDEMQKLIDRVRNESDLLLIQLVINSDCP